MFDTVRRLHRLDRQQHRTGDLRGPPALLEDHVLRITLAVGRRKDADLLGQDLDIALRRQHLAARLRIGIVSIDGNLALGTKGRGGSFLLESFNLSQGIVRPTTIFNIF